MNQPVYTFAKWQVKKGRMATVLNILTEVASKSKEETGNLFYKIYQDSSDPDTLILYEGYIDKSAVELHRASTYFQELVIGQIIPELENREVIMASEIIPGA